MAERRMLSKKITDTDAFIKMSSAAQALYFHLNQGADDDGFNDQVSLAMVKAHAAADDLKILIAKGYVVEFDSGVIVIRHWRIHNLIRQDRYKETVHIKERSMLLLDHGVYIEKIYEMEQPAGLVNQMATNCQPMVATGEDRVGKDNNSLFIAHACAKKPYGQFENVMLTEEEYEALKKKIPDAEQRIEIFSCKLKAKGYRYEDHFATILLWFAEEKNQSKTAKGSSSFDVDDFFEAALRRTYGEGEADAGAR
jgi:hypothetical protein